LEGKLLECTEGISEGAPDEFELGLRDEREDGIVVGEIEGILLGLPLGFPVDGDVLASLVGKPLGFTEGMVEDFPDGTELGLDNKMKEGVLEGSLVGIDDGSLVGIDDGSLVGQYVVGDTVGSELGRDDGRKDGIEVGKILDDGK